MGTNYRRLVQLFEARDSEREALDDLREAFDSKSIRPHDVDLGRLFEECFGWHHFRACRDRHVMANQVMAQALTEAEGAVSTSAFTNISGQIVYSAFLDPYMSEEFVFSRIIPEVPALILDGEKIAGITEIGDEVAVRDETFPYALAGVGEDWIFTPSLKDRGMIVPVTWEAIFNDRTGRLLERCGATGKWAGQNKEKRAIDCTIDENTTAHRYNWRGVTIESYNDNTGNHTWDNLAASNAFLDWTSLNAVEQVFNAMVDPFTGEPITWEPRHIVYPRALEPSVFRTLRATEIRVATPGYATSGNPTQTVVSNPWLNKYQPLSTRLVASRQATKTSWYVGDLAVYARYMVAEKMNVQTAPPNTQMEFERRIVQQFRVNERGAYSVWQPRAMVKATVA